MKTSFVKRAMALVFAVYVVGVSLPAYPHHSFSAFYQVDEEVTMTGRVLQMAVRNPHSFIHISTVNDEGKAERWTIEWGGVSQIRVSADSLKPGDEVVVVGSPPRDMETRRMKMISITRPSDGWSWSGTFD